MAKKAAKKKPIESAGVFEWRGPSRPYKKRDKSFAQTIVAIVFLLIVILFFVREWLIIGVVLSVAFVGYALATVEPNEIVYKLTKKGVWIDDTFFEYGRISHFWFENHLEHTVLVLLAPKRRNPRLILVVPPGVRDKIKQALLQNNLEFRARPFKTALDTVGEWMRRTIPLEDSSK